MFLSLGQPDKALQPRLLKGHKKAIAFLYASIYWLSECTSSFSHRDAALLP
jgi:hypothetical protein